MHAGAEKALRNFWDPAPAMTKVNNASVLTSKREFDRAIREKNKH